MTNEELKRYKEWLLQKAHEAKIYGEKTAYLEVLEYLETKGL